MDKKIPYDQFEEYLNGTLNDMELKDFEQQLSTDTDLKNELNLYQKIKKSQQNKDLTNFEANLQSAENEYFKAPEKPIKKNPTINRRIRILAAAMFIGFLIIAGLKLFQSPPSTDQLYAQFAKHEFSFQEMSSNATLGQIQTLLEKNQYTAALPLINSYLQQSPNAADIKLAQAISLLETQQYDNALSSLKALGEQYPLYQNESLWYQALTYLKLNQIPSSLNLLHQIPDDSSRYSDSQQLISILEK